MARRRADQFYLRFSYSFIQFIVKRQESTKESDIYFKQSLYTELGARMNYVLLT